MYSNMLILMVIPAIFCTLGVTVATSVDVSAIELIYTNDYTYLRVASNFVYIKLKSEGSAKIALTDTPFPSTSLDTSTQSYNQYRHTTRTRSRSWTIAANRWSTTPFAFQFSLHDFTNDNSKSQFAVNGQVKAEVETPGIFSSVFNEDKFVEILIYWNSDYLIMSRIGDPFPLFYWKDESYGLQRIKYIGIRIENQNTNNNYGTPSSTVNNQWMINFSSPFNTSYAFGETITKPTVEDTEKMTTELPPLVNISHTLPDEVELPEQLGK